jgi:hypothetical protein
MDECAGSAHAGAHMYGAPRKCQLMSACSNRRNNNYSCMRCRAGKKKKAPMLGSKNVYNVNNVSPSSPTNSPPDTTRTPLLIRSEFNIDILFTKNIVTSQDLSFKSTCVLS